MLGRDEVTECRPCRVLGKARNTQRRKASVADDEPRLVKRIVWMASEYGRYGYRRITALLRSEGWWVNHKRVERIWRQECLPRPALQFSTGVHTLPDPPTLGATGYPRVDSTQPQRCTFQPAFTCPVVRCASQSWSPSARAAQGGERATEKNGPTVRLASKCPPLQILIQVL